MKYLLPVVFIIVLSCGGPRPKTRIVAAIRIEEQTGKIVNEWIDFETELGTCLECYLHIDGKGCISIPGKGDYCGIKRVTILESYKTKID